MKRITDYELVTGTPSDLTNRVRTLLRAGWEPHAGPVVHSVGGYANHAQAMVKTEDDGKPNDSIHIAVGEATKQA